jgi:hypothetical protein
MCAPTTTHWNSIQTEAEDELQVGLVKPRSRAAENPSTFHGPLAMLLISDFFILSSLGLRLGFLFLPVEF